MTLTKKIRITRMLLLIVIVFVFCSICSAQDPNTFYSEDTHFSFLPPHGWDVMSHDYMKGKLSYKAWQSDQNVNS